jgi:hypothetical protein
MSHHALLEYIRKAKDCGASDADVADRLHKAGWYRVDVQDALELYPKLAVASKRVAVQHRRSHSYDPYLVAVAVLSFVVAFFGFLWLTSY